MNSIDFGDHRSEVNAMIAIFYKCGVRGDATLCVVIFVNYTVVAPSPRSWQISFPLKLCCNTSS